MIQHLSRDNHEVMLDEETECQVPFRKQNELWYIPLPQEPPPIPCDTLGSFFPVAPSPGAKHFTWIAEVPNYASIKKKARLVIVYMKLYKIYKRVYEFKTLANVTHRQIQFDVVQIMDEIFAR